MNGEAEAALAARLLDARRRAGLMPLPSATHERFDLAVAYRVAERAGQVLRTEGRRPRGWKIGFTNRRIWPIYGVHQPIWGRVWDDTLTLLDAPTVDVPLAGLVQPRLEPEIVFGLGSDVPAGADLQGVVDCIEWFAHGVEIVHTHFADWRFGSAADTVADFGLHGRLVVGPRCQARERPALVDDLASLALSLDRRTPDGAFSEVDRGQGAQVLDGPVQALAHAVRAMAPLGLRMAAGDVVTTGTLTDAWPVAPGQVWRTRLDDARLAGLTLRFAD